ncbi:class I SAM-dependent methyltransferase [Actinoplanes missouriensis]|uniref:class I SAM-dependent methyltransferase n=1 Tax=Actinoplanes missouriensis TaxID=1866 RepID=UPI0033F29DAD
MPTPDAHRRLAESFGLDAERYDRTRPRYPAAMVERIVAALPGADVLDVGTGTGIAAEQFRAAGCRVLGLDPDDRMAALARRRGFPVEVSAFETWDPAGRSFDGVIAGQAWHWVDPVAGARQGARVLRPGGGIALFWNAFTPDPEVAATFAEVYRRVAPSLPFTPWAAPAGDTAKKDTGFHDRAARGLTESGAFTEAELWTHAWDHTYRRDDWLDQVPTSGGHQLLPPAELDALLDGLAAVIGETVTIGYTTVLTTATRTGQDVSSESSGPALPAG